MRNISKKVTILLLLFDLLMIFSSNLINVKASEEKRFYIVYLGDHPINEDAHIQVLSSVKESYAEAKESMVYSYTKSFNAFAAKLSSDEANKLAEMDEVLSIIPNQYRKLHTTRSWDFIGLPLKARRKKAESNIVVGLLDTGITPGSDSFKNDGIGPDPPKNWKGTCDVSANFSGCNHKIIGARYFKLDGDPDPLDVLSPLDLDGHGTHTSSTLAGNYVPNANLFGLAKGTSRGAVPLARVAMYKVCWISSGCSDMDMLAAFEAAIDDGVDIISISIGGGLIDYTVDSISVGAFHALKKGIITVASAGNDGPSLGSVANHAPWLVTVAASGIDRTFKSKVQFGNGKSIFGIGISSFQPKQNMYPLVSGDDVAHNSSNKEDARRCNEDALDSKKVKGKLVLCLLGNYGADSVIKGIGGVGTIVESDRFLDTAQIFMAPATMVNSTVGGTIRSYIHSPGRSATAVINKSREVQVRAPFIASFSSRGPNRGTNRVLKPDIAAPGVDILASYTPLKSLTGLKGDTQFSKFTIMSGTSMACPHVAGAAAYVKSFRPHWSPAAIKSAILTTAQPMSQRVNIEAEFAYGTGQLNPRRALNPGLVYDMNDKSYVQFLCLEGYPNSSIATLIGSKSAVNCPSLIRGLGYDGLNYPTFQLTLKSNKKTTFAIYRRTVTNVGPASSVYNVTVRAPRGAEITVTPRSLVFTKAMQKKSFKVLVKANWDPKMEGKMVSGRLAWKSSRYVVRSPIVVYSPYQEDDHVNYKVTNEINYYNNNAL